MFNYNIHDLVRVQSNKPLTRLNRFAVDSLGGVKPDIVVVFGSFTPDLTGYKKIRKCWIGDHSLYCKDHYKLCFFELWLRNIDSEQTTINFSGDPIFSNEIFYVLIFEPYLTYVFSRKNTLFLHSSSVSSKGKGVLVSGKTGIGKTTTLLSFLPQKAVKYFSDDQTIVNGHTLYSYPMPIGLQYGIVKHSKLLLRPIDALYILFYSVVNKVTFNYGHLTRRVLVKDIGFDDDGIMGKFFMKTPQVGDAAPLNFVFILMLGEKPDVTRLTPDEAFEELKNNNMKNEDKQKLIFRFFSKYQQVYPNFKYWEHFDRILKNFSEENIRFYKVSLSKRYDLKAVFPRVLDISRGDGLND